MIDARSNTAASPQFAVISKSAHMPSRCYGAYRYQHIALVELAPGARAEDVHAISTRDRAVQSIIEDWDRVHVGGTDRSEGVRLIRRLREQAAMLNAA